MSCALMVRYVHASLYVHILYIHVYTGSYLYVHVCTMYVHDLALYVICTYIDILLIFTKQWSAGVEEPCLFGFSQHGWS